MCYFVIDLAGESVDRPSSGGRVPSRRSLVQGAGGRLEAQRVRCDTTGVCLFFFIWYGFLYVSKPWRKGLGVRRGFDSTQRRINYFHFLNLVSRQSMALSSRK